MFDRAALTTPRHQRWLDWLLPPRCAGCRRRGDWLCDDCRLGLERLAPARANRPWAAYRYHGPLATAIQRLKYGGEAALAEPLGQLLAESLLSEAGRLDRPYELLVPVPLHSARQRQRGYNQSELLARPLARLLARPLTTDRLVRWRATPAQVGQTAAARRASVAGAFRWCGPPLTGQSLLLIDDVTTTGATLGAAASTLWQAGAGSILAISLARG